MFHFWHKKKGKNRGSSWFDYLPANLIYLICVLAFLPISLVLTRPAVAYFTTKKIKFPTVVTFISLHVFGRW